MRVVRGRVVGNTVVLEESGPLPQGAVAEVLVREAGEDGDCDVTDEQWALLMKAHEQIRRGESVSVDDLAARLRAQH